MRDHPDDSGMKDDPDLQTSNKKGRYLSTLALISS
jgi:hypothetical protein